MKKMKKNICKRMTQENKKENEYNHHTNCVTMMKRRIIP